MNDLTIKEKKRYLKNVRQEHRYVPQLILNAKEQIATGLTNPLDKVGSTVETPVLDETNILYKVEGIDVDALYNVLTLHGRTQKNMAESTKGYEPEDSNKQLFVVMEQQVGDIKEVWAHTKSGNFIMKAEDIFGAEESQESLNDMIEDKKQQKNIQLYIKEQEVKKKIMFNLQKAREEYHYWKNEKKVMTGKKYLDAEKNIKKCFVKIKFLEKLKEKFEGQLEELFFKKTIVPQMDKLFGLFIERQQRMIAHDKEPEYTFEELIGRSKPYLSKYVKQYEDYISVPK